MELIKTISAVVTVLGTLTIMLFSIFGVVLVIIAPAIYLLLRMPLIGVPYLIAVWVALPIITRAIPRN